MKVERVTENVLPERCRLETIRKAVTGHQHIGLLAIVLSPGEAITIPLPLFTGKIRGSEATFDRGRL
jgi:hypothetical protein